MSYSDIAGVHYRHYTEEDLEEEPPEASVEEAGAVLDELHFDNGKLWITIDTETNGYIHLDIPVVAKDSWNDFFDSLPTWTK